MATTIQFIDDPRYIIDFREYVAPKHPENILACAEKIKNIVLACVLFTPVLAGSALIAAYETLRCSGASFKHIVLGFYGSWYNFRLKQDIFLVVFKIVFWVMAMGWCFITTTCRLTYEKIPALYNPLEGFNDQIDISHITTKDFSLDASGVDAAITVDKVLEIYDQINFDHQDQSGYMTENSRKEGVNPYTKEELRVSLQAFMDNVRGRVAFLGTPPIYDTPRLMSFYQQIEDAVRLSISKSDQDLAAFRQRNGEDPSSYSEAAKKEYSNILEDRAHIAIDLAIAGKHCGARYMGEAMDVYYQFYGDSVRDAGSLLDTLIEILAQKRMHLAKARIQEDLGTDTHSYNKYMSNLGEILGIPGTKNIVEHLASDINRDHHLERFFEFYTVDFIIDTIQGVITGKKGQILRTKIFDWLRDQVRDWNREKYLNSDQGIIERIQKALSEEVDVSLPLTHVRDFLEIIAELKKAQIALPLNADWSDFSNDLFALDAVKQFYKQKYSSLNAIQLVQRRNELKQVCSEERLGIELLNELQKTVRENTPFEFTKFQKHFANMQKVGRILKETEMDPGTALRIVKGELDLTVVVKDSLELVRSREFLERLNVEDIAQKGLSKEFMEWLLVHHHILLPQVSEIEV